MMTDLFAHLYFDDPKLANEQEDEDFSLESALARAEARAKAREAEKKSVSSEPDLNDPNDWEDLS